MSPWGTARTRDCGLPEQDAWLGGPRLRQSGAGLPGARGHPLLLRRHRREVLCAVASSRGPERTTSFLSLLCCHRNAQVPPMKTGAFQRTCCARQYCVSSDLPGSRKDHLRAPAGTFPCSAEGWADLTPVGLSMRPVFRGAGAAGTALSETTWARRRQGGRCVDSWVGGGPRGTHGPFSLLSLTPPQGAETKPRSPILPSASSGSEGARGLAQDPVCRLAIFTRSTLFLVTLKN